MNQPTSPAASRKSRSVRFQGPEALLSMAAISSLWAVVLVGLVVVTAATVTTVFASPMAEILQVLGVIRG